MKLKVKSVRRSPQADELDYDYELEEPAPWTSYQYQTEQGAATLPGPQGPPIETVYDEIFGIPEPEDYYDPQEDEPITDMETGEPIPVDEEANRRELAELAQLAEEFKPTWLPVAAAPTPHAGDLSSEALASYVERKPGEPYVTILKKRAPATVDELIQELQDRVREGSDFDPTPEHLRNKEALETLKRAVPGAPQPAPAVRAIGPGLAGPPIQQDIPAWSAPTSPTIRKQNWKPIGGK